jgi:ribosomal protein L40E
MDLPIEQATEQGTTMTCPTCNAEQPWQDECRRCKSDLGELRAVWQASQRAHLACLRALREGTLDRALDEARKHVSLNASDDALRLLSVCHLLRGEWQAALDAGFRCIAND